MEAETGLQEAIAVVSVSAAPAVVEGEVVAWEGGVVIMVVV
jgi:hypothetical protein